MKLIFCYLAFEYLSLLDGLSDLVKMSPAASSSRVTLADADGWSEEGEGSSLCPPAKR